MKSFIQILTVVGKYPETIRFLVELEPALFGLAPTHLVCVRVQCLIHSPTRTATKISASQVSQEQSTLPYTDNQGYCDHPVRLAVMLV